MHVVIVNLKLYHFNKEKCGCVCLWAGRGGLLFINATAVMTPCERQHSPATHSKREIRCIVVRTTPE